LRRRQGVVGVGLDEADEGADAVADHRQLADPGDVDGLAQHLAAGKYGGALGMADVGNRHIGWVAVSGQVGEAGRSGVGGGRRAEGMAGGGNGTG